MTNSRVTVPNITVAIVSHGDHQEVQRLLESIERFYPQSCDLEVVIVENLPTAELNFRSPDKIPIRVIQNADQKGFGENVNLGLQETQAKYFCILNPDVVLTEPLFDAFVTIVETSSIDILAPIAVNEDGEIQDSFRKVPSPAEIFLRYIGLKSRDVRIESGEEFIYPDWIQGMFMFMKAEVYKKLSGFNPDYRLYFEDVDFCCRARLAGYSIGVDTTYKILHEAKQKSKRNLTYLYWHTQSAVKFFSSQVYQEINNLNKGN